VSLHWESAAELARSVRAGERRAVDVVEAHLARIAATDEVTGSFLRVAREQALEEAAAVDADVAAGKDPGRLAGVPVAVKDNICTQGLETTAASKILAGYTPPYDATVVARLRAAGAVIVGKTNLDEFGMGSSTENSSRHPTRNPWDPTRVPGGSSGGSAACVAAGQVPLALGSDTGGSIRQPAALCGCVGIKPSYGLLSRYGLLAFGSSLDQIGPLARSVTDACLVLDAACGLDPRDMTSRDPGQGLRSELYQGDAPFVAAADAGSLEGVTLGLVTDYLTMTSDSEVRAAVEAALDAARAAGAAIKEVSLQTCELAIPTYQVLSTAEASSNLGRYDGVHYGHRADHPQGIVDLYARSRAEGFGPEVRRRIVLGTFVLSSGFYDAYYLQAEKVRELIRQDFTRALQGVDALIGPTSPVAAFPLGERVEDPLAMYAVDVFTVSTNLAALPAVSLPCGFTAAGLPLGIQLTGHDLGDAALLGLAAALERALALPARRPEALA
jgi:aspartyl-tRNA(Asn)/glutamyl-tRNA(Gln) amidotransferase subunit A